jgi:hypothetical protein
MLLLNMRHNDEVIPAVKFTNDLELVSQCDLVVLKLNSNHARVIDMQKFRSQIKIHILLCNIENKMSSIKKINA